MGFGIVMMKEPSDDFKKVINPHVCWFITPINYR